MSRVMPRRRIMLNGCCVCDLHLMKNGLWKVVEGSEICLLGLLNSKAAARTLDHRQRRTVLFRLWESVRILDAMCLLRGKH